MKQWQKDAILFLLASPIIALAAMGRLLHRLQWLRLAVRPSLNCRVCGAEISLVGFWRCSCGYSYQGHLLRPCAVCGAMPRMARCFQCSATRSIG